MTRTFVPRRRIAALSVAITLFAAPSASAQAKPPAAPLALRGIDTVGVDVSVQDDGSPGPCLASSIDEDVARAVESAGLKVSPVSQVRLRYQVFLHQIGSQCSSAYVVSVTAPGVATFRHQGPGAQAVPSGALVMWQQWGSSTARSVTPAFRESLVSTIVSTTKSLRASIENANDRPGPKIVKSSSAPRIAVVDAATVERLSLAGLRSLTVQSPPTFALRAPCVVRDATSVVQRALADGRLEVGIAGTGSFWRMLRLSVSAHEVSSVCIAVVSLKLMVWADVAYGHHPAGPPTGEPQMTLWERTAIVSGPPSTLADQVSAWFTTNAADLVSRINRANTGG